MSFPRYPKYKPSGVEWLDEVPESWEVRRIKHLGKTITGGTPKTEQPEYWTDGDVPWLPSGKVQNGTIHKEDADIFITKRALAESAAKLIKPGSALIALTGATCANSAFLAFESTANQSVVGIEPKSNSNGRFIYYSLLAQREQVLTHKSGGAQGGINQEDVRNLVITAPEKVEQTAVAEFLDRETGKIDGLVAEQRRLMELLKEKRQAVISHAVTKGLNPHAPMKPSGIEWLGDVPEGWAVKKMKQVSSLKGRLGWQGLKAEEYRDEGPFVVSSAHFDNFAIDWSSCPHVSLERYELDSNIQLSEGDVLLMKDGAALGKLAFLDRLPDLACLNSHLLLFRPLTVNERATYISSFLFFLMRTDYFQKHITLHATGTTFAGISQEKIGNYQVALPPLEEQSAIIAFLQTEVAKFDTLTAEAQRTIDLLQERRTALVSAAVTGQIDVRQHPKN